MRRLYALIRFILYYAKALVLSNVYVAYEVLTPTHHMQPGVVDFPLKIKKDIPLFILTNLISMTPGSLCLEVSQDRKKLFIHSMYIKGPDIFANEVVEKFEKYLMEIFG